MRGNIRAALEDCQASEFDGIEGPMPLNPKRRDDFTRELRTAAVPYIAEITTGGGYVPDAGTSPEWHLEDFRRKAEASLEGNPLFLTVLAGSDAWPLAQSVDFLGRLLAIAEELGIAANIETHRSRILFHPWITREILGQLPELAPDLRFLALVLRVRAAGPGGRAGAARPLRQPRPAHPRPRRLRPGRAGAAPRRAGVRPGAHRA